MAKRYGYRYNRTFFIISFEPSVHPAAVFYANHSIIELQKTNLFLEQLNMNRLNSIPVFRLTFSFRIHTEKKQNLPRSMIRSGDIFSRHRMPPIPGEISLHNLKGSFRQNQLAMGFTMLQSSANWWLGFSTIPFYEKCQKKNPHWLRILLKTNSG